MVRKDYSQKEVNGKVIENTCIKCRWHNDTTVCWACTRNPEDSDKDYFEETK